MDFTEFKAKTVDEAITQACLKYGVTSDRLEFDVIEEGRAGFFGIGSRDSIPNNYTSFNNRKPAAPKQQTFSSYQGASSRSAAQPARPANTQTNVRSSVKQESLDIPSFLRQPPRR